MQEFDNAIYLGAEVTGQIARAMGQKKYGLANKDTLSHIAR